MTNHLLLVTSFSGEFYHRDNFLPLVLSSIGNGKCVSLDLVVTRLYVFEFVGYLETIRCCCIGKTARDIFFAILKWNKVVIRNWILTKGKIGLLGTIVQGLCLIIYSDTCDLPISLKRWLFRTGTKECQKGNEAYKFSHECNFKCKSTVFLWADLKK